jgi:hypothetical protein
MPCWALLGIFAHELLTFSCREVRSSLSKWHERDVPRRAFFGFLQKDRASSSSGDRRPALRWKLQSVSSSLGGQTPAPVHLSLRIVRCRHCESRTKTTNRIQGRRKARPGEYAFWSLSRPWFCAGSDESYLMSHLMCESEVGTVEVLETSVMHPVFDLVKRELSTSKDMNLHSYDFDGP